MKTDKYLIGLLFLLPSLGMAQSSSKINNQFAFDFFKQISMSEKGNIFFSPISLSTAMGMTYAGTAGETQKQIAKVFHFPANSKKFHSQQGSTIKWLGSKADSIELSIVNMLWAEKTYPFKNSYSKLIKKTYSAAVEPVDFINKYEESRTLINDNILKATNDKIKNLLPAGSVNNLTRLVLTNAVYFKANWQTKFEKDKTIDAKFYVTPQDPLKCRMMGAKSNFNYFEDAKIQALDLSYSGNNYSMLIILPRNNESVEELVKGMTQESLSTITKGLTLEKINISIPRFQFSTGYQLKQVLSEMGMPQPFSDDANFSNMTSRNDLKISDVFHKAFIEVNEQGTEAAAATAVVVRMKSIGNEKFFTANHPFVFLIREKSTGTILFMGRMVDPTKGE